jgi:phosphate transport system substrate-binding protein
VDYAWAMKNKMSFAAVKNHAGHFISASPASITAAAGAVFAPLGMSSDLRTSITDAPGDDSYPLAAFTYLLISERINDPNKRAAMSDFLQWMVTTGQKETASFDFAPLPKEVVAIEKRRIQAVKVK